MSLVVVILPRRLWNPVFELFLSYSRDLPGHGVTANPFTLVLFRTLRMNRVGLGCRFQDSLLCHISFEHVIATRSTYQSPLGRQQ